MQYFIDTNLILDVFERNNSDSKNRLKTILANDDNEIFYNGLVYTEALRTVLDENTFSVLKSSFDYFTLVDINQAIYMETKKFSRYCRAQEIKVSKGRCELIDMIHFITAKYYSLELLSNDGDFDKLEKAHRDFKS